MSGTKSKIQLLNDEGYAKTATPAEKKEINYGLTSKTFNDVKMARKRARDLSAVLKKYWGDQKYDEEKHAQGVFETLKMYIMQLNVENTVWLKQVSTLSADSDELTVGNILDVLTGYFEKEFEGKDKAWSTFLLKNPGTRTVEGEMILPPTPSKKSLFDKDTIIRYGKEPVIEEFKDDLDEVEEGFQDEVDEVEDQFLESAQVFNVGEEKFPIFPADSNYIRDITIESIDGSTSQTLKPWIIAAISVGGVMFLLSFGLMTYCCVRKYRIRNNKSKEDNIDKGALSHERHNDNNNVEKNIVEAALPNNTRAYTVFTSEA